MKNKQFETTSFSVPASQYIRSVLLRVFAHWWWLPTLGIVAFLVLAALVDFAFVFVALILGFIIVPTVMMFAYFYHSTTPEARIAVLSKKIVIDKDYITIVFDPLQPKGDDEDATTPITPKPIIIGRSEISRVDNMGKTIVFHLKGSRYRCITIPTNVIKGEVTDFLAHVLQ